ncbi:MAG: GNAT family N-acetyltransferase [Acidobacteria bacterium]|nr:GNAT family N-acetyltransferase [Acidobacteriota bacterium]
MKIDFSDVRLVAATPGDAEAIAALHTESWRSAYRGLVPDAYLAGPIVEDRRQVWTARLAVPDAAQLVLKAVEDDQLVGFTCVLRDADPAWGPLLDNLHVRPGRRGRGIGAALLHAARQWSATVSPGQPMHLWVIEGNVRARRFYDREHGRVVERRDIELTAGIVTPALRYVWE